jgi:hypothetical protein
LLAGCGSSRVKRLCYPDRRSWSNLVRLDIEPCHKPDIVADLNSPLPFADHTFAEIHAYEVLEHLGRQGDVSSFFAVFAELWRILERGGLLFASCPDWRSLWAFGDPGHTRVINEGTLVFLDQDSYAREVGRTAMSDYRSYWPHSFKSISADVQDGTFYFVLQAE